MGLQKKSDWHTCANFQGGKSQKPARKIGTRSWFVRVRQKFGSTLNLLFISDIDAICAMAVPHFLVGQIILFPSKKIWFPTRHSKSQTWVNPIVDGEVLVLFVELRVWLLKRLFLVCWTPTLVSKTWSVHHLKRLRSNAWCRKIYEIHWDIPYFILCLDNLRYTGSRISINFPFLWTLSRQGGSNWQLGAACFQWPDTSQQ